MWSIFPFSLFVIAFSQLRSRRLILKNHRIWLLFVCILCGLTVLAEFSAHFIAPRHKHVSTARQKPHNAKARYVQAIEPGDILLYGSLRNRNTEIIRFFERRENGSPIKGYYHVAIALNSRFKIEANGAKVSIQPIRYGSLDIFRPPIPVRQRDTAISYLKNFNGQSYDWWVVVDDVLRYQTHNVIHLPVFFIQLEEHYKKTCSSLAACYFSMTEWGDSLDSNASPEDIYQNLKGYQVVLQNVPVST